MGVEGVITAALRWWMEMVYERGGCISVNENVRSLEKCRRK